MSRRAFTLIELLVIVAILAVMVSIGVGSIRGGQNSARVKGATRDIFGSIRHARSVALVTGQPAIITYSTESVDGEVVAKVEITSAKLLDSTVDRSKVETLTGELPKGEKFELVHIRGKESSKDGKTGLDDDGGEEVMPEGAGDTVEDVLFSPMNSDVVSGMRLKVIKGDELLQTTETTRKPKISVFSNVDYLLGKFEKSKAKTTAAAKTDESKAKDGETKDKVEEDQKPVSVVWETNGRVEPHQVYVYPDGKKPEDGLMIKIDRFGAAKVYSGDGSGGDDDDE